MLSCLFSVAENLPIAYIQHSKTEIKSWRCMKTLTVLGNFVLRKSYQIWSKVYTLSWHQSVQPQSFLGHITFAQLSFAWLLRNFQVDICITVYFFKVIFRGKPHQELWIIVSHLYKIKNILRDIYAKIERWKEDDQQ